MVPRGQKGLRGNRELRGVKGTDVLTLLFFLCVFDRTLIKSDRLGSAGSEMDVKKQKPAQKNKEQKR